MKLAPSEAPESFGTPSSEAIAEAQANGLYVRWPGKRELLIDIDSCEGKATFEKNFKILDQYFLGMVVKREPSRSGDDCHEHITVGLPLAVSPIERIALQAALGSDPTRELLSYGRYIDGDPHPTLFFEKPELLPAEQREIEDGRKFIAAHPEIPVVDISEEVPF